MSEGVCPVCGTDWYRVLEHDETMKRENINFCPVDGRELVSGTEMKHYDEVLKEYDFGDMKPGGGGPIGDYEPSRWGDVAIVLLCGLAGLVFFSQFSPSMAIAGFFFGVAAGVFVARKNREAIPS